MEILQLLVELLDVIAWPIVVLMALSIFRRPLSKAIAQISKVRYGDLEVELGRARELGADIESHAPPERTEDRQIPASVIELARISPRVGILESWKSLESAILVAGRAHGIELGEPGVWSPRNIVHALAADDAITSEQAEFFLRAYAIRNRMVHEIDTEFTADQALTIIDVQNDLRVFFESLASGA